MKGLRKVDKNHWEGKGYRKNEKFNYEAIWRNLTTIRFDIGGDVIELPCDESEFYDVAIGNKCTTGNCPFCYVGANQHGEYYDGICETWKKWMETKRENEKPFQIAIGSQGEPTEHPLFTEFLKTVYETGVVPNYTTNGVILSAWNNSESKYYERANAILEATAQYCGGVAVSFGNKALEGMARQAIDGLLGKGDCHVMIHHIISDKESVDKFLDTANEYGNNIRYHVLLPLMAHGRSTQGIQDGVFEYLEEEIKTRGIKNVAFGANFAKNLKTTSLKIWNYPQEAYSKNVLLETDRVVVTPSSFNLQPLKVIGL